METRYENIVWSDSHTCYRPLIKIASSIKKKKRGCERRICILPLVSLLGYSLSTSTRSFSPIITSRVSASTRRVNGLIKTVGQVVLALDAENSRNFALAHRSGGVDVSYLIVQLHYSSLYKNFFVSFTNGDCFWCRESSIEIQPQQQPFNVPSSFCLCICDILGRTLSKRLTGDACIHQNRFGCIYSHRKGFLRS